MPIKLIIDNILFIFQTLDFQCADEYQFLQGAILNEVKYLGRRFFADAQNDTKYLQNDVTLNEVKDLYNYN